MYFVFVGKAHVCALLQQSITHISFSLEKRMSVHYYNNLLHIFHFRWKSTLSVHYYNNLLHIFHFRWQSPCLCITTASYYIYFISVGKAHACALLVSKTSRQNQHRTYCHRFKFLSFPLKKIYPIQSLMPVIYTRI